MSTLLLILRHNISLESDVSLAQAEIATLCSLSLTSINRITSVKELSNWNEKLDGVESRFINRQPRANGTVGFHIEGASGLHFKRIIEQAAFIQEALLIESPEIEQLSVVQRFTRSREISKHIYNVRGLPIAAILEYSSPLVSRRDKVGNVATALEALTEFLLDETSLPTSFAEHIKAALLAKKTTLYLSHELHLYKGKFFPRLVHSLINRYGHQGGLIADPFAGSGTALLEAALLGHDSVGLDVDPTSVLISQHKMVLANVDPAELLEVCASMQAAVAEQQTELVFDNRTYEISHWRNYLVQVPEPMRYRLNKRGNEEGYDLLGDLERDAAIALTLISQIPTHLQSLFKVCLSHALTKKIRLRFVGIGNGRFTFDVAKVGVLELFLKKAYHMLAIAEAFSWLKWSGMQLGNVTVHHESALNLNNVLPPHSVDLVITSPPYIPASSGREHYARARAIPLVLTGAATIEELELLDQSFIGEMSGQGVHANGAQPLPPRVQRTLDFLTNDEQRRPKYLPTLQYYFDIRKVLRNVREALAENGKALFVVANSHTFYIHKTKEILHSVDATGAICEIGEQIGLEVENVIEVPLLKSGGLNARLRSTDTYSEAVIVFKNPN
jgi:hypothetical protein